jgi:hypothetical protein
MRYNKKNAIWGDLMSSKYQAEPQPDDYYAYDEDEDDAADTDAWATDALVMDNPLAFSDEHMARLGLTLDFGPGDLASNRDGELSLGQIARLEQDLRFFYWPMIAALVVVAFLIGVSGTLAGNISSLIPALIVMGLAAIPAALLNRQRASLPYCRVRRTMLRLGGFSLTIRRWGIKDEHRLPVDGGKPVFGPKHIYKVLKANQTYLAYYAPVRSWRGYRLLSLEPLDSGSPTAKPKRKAKRSI